MEDTSAYDCSNVTVLLPTEKPPSSSQVLDSFWISNSSPSVQGSTSMVNLENSCGGNTADGPFVSQPNRGENGNEECDRCYHQPEKKRRLTADQVHFLERSFEVENKLGPERKIHLANELGLEPRQIAIWFQNRRARYKTKLIEKDYDSLKASYDMLKADHESLFKETDMLKSEVHLLTEKLLLREKEKAESEPCGLINSLDAAAQKTSPNTMSQSLTRVLQMVCKQEDANSAKSDVLDSSLLEPAVSSHHVYEPDQSDFSQDEEDNLGRSLLPLTRFPKLENEFYNDPNLNSCKLGYPLEDEAFWFGL